MRCALVSITHAIRVSRGSILPTRWSRLYLGVSFALVLPAAPTTLGGADLWAPTTRSTIPIECVLKSNEDVARLLTVLSPIISCGSIFWLCLAQYLSSLNGEQIWNAGPLSEIAIYGYYITVTILLLTFFYTRASFQLDGSTWPVNIPCSHLREDPLWAPGF